MVETECWNSVSWREPRMTERSAYDDKGRRKYLNKAESQKFVQGTGLLSKQEAFFCLTLYYTGCRISEALNLLPSDVDLEMRTVAIRSLKKRERKELRRLPIPEFLVEGLLEIGHRKDSAIWSFSRTTGWRLVKRVMAAVGISGIHATAKGLRHGFGVRGALVKIPITLIQNWMGHADLSTTAIYLAVKDEEERQFMKRTWD